ncbi:hypothetical protein COO91_09250 (plasmid) [Nostoc flagelliforme CCNUN1]|uniref:Uncharacterized protein n=1 Tax=Nostoc flagelliforme CCNUN1 TaxID=2038116 RepID=A0A2K8T5W6_9NOSO|nr:hypothetical protein COO91_09250 [Nostoc flagelliforme CCNUN1]
MKCIVTTANGSLERLQITFTSHQHPPLPLSSGLSLAKTWHTSPKW